MKAAPHHCKNCHKEIPAKWGDYCHDKNCQDAKETAKKAYMREYALENQPWKKTDRSVNKSIRLKRAKEQKRKCPRCGKKTLNHFACSDCLEALAGGIAEAYGRTF